MNAYFQLDTIIYAMDTSGKYIVIYQHLLTVIAVFYKRTFYNSFP